MSVENATAAPRERDGGSVDEKAVAAHHYPDQTFSATNFAAAFIAAKFGVPLCVARVICELAAIGGRVA
jgi:hypothetical protein